VISIAFSEPVNLTQSSLTLYNSLGSVVPTSGFSYNSSAMIATWQFSSPLAANKYVMNLAANSVSDTLGIPLDGEWATSVSTFAAGSGDGTPGGDFNFYFDVLPGDANSTGTVTNGDVLITKLQVGAPSTSTNYRLDVNGSDTITNGDVLLEKLQIGSNINSFSSPQLPPASEPAAAPDSATSNPAAAAAVSDAWPFGNPIVIASPAAGFAVPNMAPPANAASSSSTITAAPPAYIGMPDLPGTDVPSIDADEPMDTAFGWNSHALPGGQLADVGDAGVSSGAASTAWMPIVTRLSNPSIAAYALPSVAISTTSSAAFASSSAFASPATAAATTVAALATSPMQPVDASPAAAPIAGALFPFFSVAIGPATPTSNPADALVLVLDALGQASPGAALSTGGQSSEADFSTPPRLTGSAAVSNPASLLVLDELFSAVSESPADGSPVLESYAASSAALAAAVADSFWQLDRFGNGSRVAPPVCWPK
jgi:hypothetical protein